MWDEAFPSLLIGLREGLEAGLIVSILVATLVRSDQAGRLYQVWTGVLAAGALALSFGAVLTFTAANLSSKAQDAFGGTLSVIAVAFVTAMVFWMRRSARTLSKEIKARTTAALAMGAGVLVSTAFLAVAREGLETALFLWTTARAAGESTWPLVGASIGLVIATILCWGLYRRVLHLNLSRFFTATGAVLVVIAAGVFGYGLRDLQEGGVLPGGAAYAFDLTRHLDPGAWYTTLVQGTLNLTPQMTWLQITGYVGYLAVVMPLFLRGVQAQPAKPAPEPAAETEPTAGTEPAAGRQPGVREEITMPPAAAPAESGGPEAPTGARRPGMPRWVLPVGVVAVPAVIAGSMIVAGKGKPAEATVVSVSATECGKGFGSPKPGRQVFQVRNVGKKTSEVYLVDPASSAVYGEVENLAPGITRDLAATIGAGTYAWRCVPNGEKAVTSAAVRVSGGGTTSAVLPVSEQDLAAPLASYKAYVQSGLNTLQTQVDKLREDIRSGNLTAARADWLTGHLQYSSLGAAYGTFQDFDAKINGRIAGLPGGVADKDFAGFHRIEYGLWHGESATSLQGPADQLGQAVAGLRADFPKQDFDPGDLPLRTHEVLENTLQFELTGEADQGSGTTLATADANIQGTRKLLDVLQALIAARSPGLLATVRSRLDHTEQLVLAAKTGSGWTPVDQLPAIQRQRLNGAMGQLLEDLAPIPDLLEIRKSA